MRYLEIDTITYTDKNGKQIPIKDIRPIKPLALSTSVNVKENDLLDDLASRENVYGEFGELLSWRIFDLNIVKLTENNFNMSKIKKLNVPVKQ
jgi:hypothetical protein